MRLFDKLVKLLYPTYIDMAIGNKSPNEVVENNLDKHDNILLRDYLIPTIRWCSIE